MVFCHFPVLARSCCPEHLLWDHPQVLAILESAPSTVAYMNGHDHKGGYAEPDGVHYLAFPAMVEHSAEQSCKVVDVFPDRLIVPTAGNSAGRELKIRTRRDKTFSEARSRRIDRPDQVARDREKRETIP